MAEIGEQFDKAENIDYTDSLDILPALVLSSYLQFEYMRFIVC